MTCFLSFPSRLRDDSVLVRKNTLLVLTHLILNDMVKVKGQISEMATCIVDSEERLAALAKMFFFELSKKVNINQEKTDQLVDGNQVMTCVPFVTWPHLMKLLIR